MLSSTRQHTTAFLYCFARARAQTTCVVWWTGSAFKTRKIRWDTEMRLSSWLGFIAQVLLRVVPFSSPVASRLIVFPVDRVERTSLFRMNKVPWHGRAKKDVPARLLKHPPFCRRCFHLSGLLLDLRAKLQSMYFTISFVLDHKLPNFCFIRIAFSLSFF